MIVEIERVSTEKWEVSPCKCGEDPIIFDRKNEHDEHLRHVIIKCPECHYRWVGSSYRYQYSEVDFIAARYKAVIDAITKWENL